MFRTTSDIAVVVELLSTFFTSVTTNILSLVVAIAVMTKLDFKITLIFIASVPLAFLFRLYVSLKIRPIELRMRECKEEINGYLGESFAAIKEVKVSGTEDIETSRYQELLQKNIGLEWYLWRMNLVLGKIQAFFESGVASMLQWWIWFMVMKEFSTIGTAMAMSWYFGRIMGPFMSLAGSFQKIISAMAPGERILEVFAFEREDNCIKTKKDLTASVNTITLSNVSFSYDGKTSVISDISFKLAPGRLHFLLGKSGSGKTTLIHLLCSLYSGYQGDITMNGKSLNQISTRSLRKQVRLLEQDPWIFDSTIRENITYGSSIITQEEIEKAAHHAGIHDCITRLPNGYDTVIRPGIADLSGGERQRLSIARVLASNPSILLFDEPFSNLDVKIEREIISSLRQFYTNRIILIITHRHENIEEGDSVYDLSHNS